MSNPEPRQITQAEIEALTGKTPYVQTQEPVAFSSENFSSPNYDQIESWYYPDFRPGFDGNPAIRPQVRVYSIIGRDGKPTGRLVNANNEVQAAALRQVVRDPNGVTYLPSAELVDVIYEG